MVARTEKGILTAVTNKGKRKLGLGDTWGLNPETRARNTETDGMALPRTALKGPATCINPYLQYDSHCILTA